SRAVVTRSITNFGASVRERLLQDTKKKRGDFQLTLRRYVIERFLYRLGQSDYRERFVLKGAMLFMLWDTSIYRPTKDLDLAGYGVNDALSLIERIRKILAIPCPEDGIVFMTESMTAEPIRDGAEYHGFRLRVIGELAAARISLQIDVGFGDAIEPPATLETYPVILDAPAPRIRAYPREVSIAEKLHAMVTRGLENTRLKDFYDVYVLSSRFMFLGARLGSAITATFARRGTTMGDPWPVALTSDFYDDPARAQAWRRLLQRTKLDAGTPGDFATIGEQIRSFLDSPLRASQLGKPHIATWPPGGPWE
ncbi:MAG TPA: nucleotidyl transferase AbiEii/AbiGii toxin family protein, partial [Burkholderiales bacterium]|nr:nucleotidyl transferase AbiEii/AbiGii toxin family protein [Burkholderiales bacterium]